MWSWDFDFVAWNVKGIHRIKIKIFPFTSSVRETNIKPCSRLQWCVLPQTQTKLSAGKNDNSSQVSVLVCPVDVSSFSLSLTDNLGQTTPILWGCWGFVWAGIKFESSKENLKPPDDQLTQWDPNLWEHHSSQDLYNLLVHTSGGCQCCAGKGNISILILSIFYIKVLMVFTFYWDKCYCWNANTFCMIIILIVCKARDFGQ